MQGKFGNSSMRPYALGIQPQSSTYGQTIPIIYGRARQALYMIWQQYLRSKGGSQKWAGVKKSESQPTYFENVDFLLGHNPIPGVLQFWTNQGDKVPLIFTSYSEIASAASITIPDSPVFYFVIGVTIELPYDVTFHDYGAAGSSHLTGTFEQPLWNSLYSGPNLADQGQYRNYPYIYTWFPGSGRTIYLDGGPGGALNGFGITIHYAAIDPSSGIFSKLKVSSHVPVSAMRLMFESQLGSGSEYSNPQDHTDQQIIYPHYAGLGSEGLDLGATAIMPNILCETMGAHTLYKDGDADFADMIEDILTRGPIQGGFAGPGLDGVQLSPVQSALACFDFPCAVQKLYAESDGAITDVTFHLPNAAGNILLAFVRYDGGLVDPVITDSAGNVWTLAAGPGTAPPVDGEFQALYYATAVAAQNNTVSVSDTGSHTQLFVLELGGIDSFDVVATANSLTDDPALTITTTNDPGSPTLIVAIVNTEGGVTVGTPAGSRWKPMIKGTAEPYAAAGFRVVYNPGDNSIPGFAFATGAWSAILISFKLSVPPSYPKPLLDIIDHDSLELTRLQCRANSLWGSLVMDSQRKGGEWLQDILDAANAAAVWSGFRLKIIPRSETSEVGNGAIYHAPSAAGPVWDITDDDYETADGEAPVTIERKAQVDAKNILQMQHPNRGTDYNQVVTAEQEQGSIAIYGPRKQSPKVISCIQDVAVARPLLAIEARKQNFLRITYKFKLPARFGLIEPMDLITLTEKTIGLAGTPVRILTVEEDEKFSLSCEAEPFIYGLYAPQAVPITTPDPFRSSPGYVPLPVNPPVIFQPVPELVGGRDDQLWLAVSDADPLYGGCQVWMSTNGETGDYALLGTMFGNAITGRVVGDWPAAKDPDTSHDLHLNLAESLGDLESFSVTQEDKFVPVCIIAGGPARLPYELISYAVANLTSANHYTLKATGAGHKLRRAVYDTPFTGFGFDHPNDSHFAFLGPTLPGVFDMKLDPGLRGKQLWFKFVQFNELGGGFADLADCVAYPFIPWEATSRAPYPWFPGAQPNVLDDSFYGPFDSTRDFFTISQLYGETADEAPVALLPVSGQMPINDFSPVLADTPIIGSFSTTDTGGNLPGGVTYYFGLSAIDVDGMFTEPAVKLQCFVPAGTATNTITLADIHWPDNVQGWALWGGLDPAQLSFQGILYAGSSLNAWITLTGPNAKPTTITIAGDPTFPTGIFLQFTGLPDAAFDHIVWKIKPIVHAGIWGAPLLYAGNTGGIMAMSLAAAGLNYAVDNLVELSGAGDGNSIVRVASVDDTGAITNWEEYSGGSGYAAAAGVTTTALSGVGTGATFDVVTVSTGPFLKMQQFGAAWSADQFAARYVEMIGNAVNGFGIRNGLPIAHFLIVGNDTDGNLFIDTGQPDPLDLGGRQLVPGDVFVMNLEVTSITSESTGAVVLAVVNDPGTGFLAGEILDLAGGDSNCQLVITSVAPITGQITGFLVIGGGTNYALATGVAASGGSGVGALFDITLLSPVAIQSMADSLIVNPYFPLGNVPSGEKVNVIRFRTGINAGHPTRIADNTDDTFKLAGQWPVGEPSIGDKFIVETDGWSNQFSVSAAPNPKLAKNISAELDVTNYAGVQLLVYAIAVNPIDGEADEAESPYRIIYLFGGQGVPQGQVLINGQ